MPRAARNLQRITFSSADPADVEIVGFASFLATIFGSRRRGLATAIRLTPAFRQWRATVERCPYCQCMVSLTRIDATSAVSYANHDAPPGTPCPGSHRHTRWTGGDRDNAAASVAAAQLELAVRRGPQVCRLI